MVNGRIEPALKAVLRERPDAMFVGGGAPTYVYLRRFVEFAGRHHLPAG